MILKFLAARQAKVPFTVPHSVLLIPPLEINNSAASGVSAFREVMHYDNLMLSFSKNGLYEAAGTVWMLDPVHLSGSDGMSIHQLESAMWMWSEEAFVLSSSHPPSRRYSFVVPLPALVLDVKIAQRQRVGKAAVVMAHALPLLAGRAIVIGWYAAMAEALGAAASGASAEVSAAAGNDDRVFKLFEAALSEPISLRITPDKDGQHLVSLLFSESMFSSASATGAD